MSVYKITIPGLEAVANEQNMSLFDFLQVPEMIDKEILVDNIIIEAGAFESLYSDIEFIRRKVAVWSARNQRTWEKWAAALDIDYDPLENYDRHEEWTDTHEGEKSEASLKTGTSSETESGTDGNTHTYNNVKDDHQVRDLTSENKRAAFNSATYENAEKDINSGSEDTTRSGSETDSGTNSSTKSGSTSDGVQSSGTDEYLNTRRGRAHGNIGTLTSQAMLQSELDIARWNLYNQITDMFIVEFTLPIFD